jgi:hypothetical protein
MQANKAVSASENKNRFRSPAQLMLRVGSFAMSDVQRGSVKMAQSSGTVRGMGGPSPSVEMAE